MQSSGLPQTFLRDCGHSPCTSLPTLLVAASSFAVFCSENVKCVRAWTLCIYRVCYSHLGSGYKSQIQTEPNNMRYLHWCSYHLRAMKLGKLEVEIRGKSPFQVLSFLLNNSHVVQRAARTGAELFCLALGT